MKKEKAKVMILIIFNISLLFYFVWGILIGISL